MTAATDWQTSKATYDTAAAAVVTAKASFATAQTDLDTKIAALAALVDVAHPVKVYNPTGTTFVVVELVNGAVIIRQVTM